MAERSYHFVVSLKSICPHLANGEPEEIGLENLSKLQTEILVVEFGVKASEIGQFLTARYNLITSINVLLQAFKIHILF